jgi:ATP-dependent protease ClpP protease subunit
MNDERAEDEPKSLVRAEGNTIFFFCDVTHDTVRDLCTLLKKVSLVLDAIKIAIRSDGGDVYAGLAAMDYIRTLTARGITIDTVAYGICASAATFILLAGSRRLMGKNSYVLIHQLSADMWGKYEELKDEMRTNKKIMKHLARLYTEETSVPPEKLEKLMTRDVTLSSSYCLKYGVVHEII